MRRDALPLVATVGTVFLAVMCCVGLPLLAAAVAAVGAGALFGGISAALVVAVIVAVIVWARYRLRRGERGVPDA